ncbi:MAG: CopG family transcriptional regulator [FCB group bacterium]|nr:CopG family transcriptional regulator [FCB group bacterium]MBL7029515.1 CopG family transcriptional regulator [Candidatus Neomarinimicrobiota bacterium]MBL7122946.1 CopG family transcriptional regulator [Candidatus Neomarinimicrobiota bacterium]
MSASKIAITIDSTLLDELDRLVVEKKFPSRSRAIQIAVAEKLKKIHATRLAVECSKLDPELEQSMADESLNEELESWPEY